MNRAGEPDRTRPAFITMVVMFLGTSAALVGNYYIYDSIGPVAEQLSRELGFSDTQIGTLNAIYSLPNIVMVLIGGVLVDRFSARSVTLVTTLICLLGAVLTALGEKFVVMAASRLLFGIGAETMIVATICLVFFVSLFLFSFGAHHYLRVVGLLPRRLFVFVCCRSVLAGMAAAAVAGGGLRAAGGGRRRGVLAGRPVRSGARLPRHRAAGR